MKESLRVGLDPMTRLSNLKVLPVQIDGSALTTTSSSAGCLVGASAVNVKDDGSNTVTITFKETKRNAPMVFATAKATDTVVDAVTSSTTSVIYTTVQNDATGSAVADADVDLLLVWFDDSDVQ